MGSCVGACTVEEHLALFEGYFVLPPSRGGRKGQGVRADGAQNTSCSSVDGEVMMRVWCGVGWCGECCVVYYTASAGGRQDGRYAWSHTRLR